jgi:copper chaperone NosL
MKRNQLHLISRVVLVLSALVLTGVLRVPMWRIELNAPQYPEGLKLLIYPDRLGGNVDIINGLNHYIGMKTLHTADFIEFTLLPWCIIFFVVAFVLAAVLGKRRWLNGLFLLFVVFGVIAMADFWRWEYDYGHHLNPEAAIIVPGMAYQPPLIGFKQLLNFGAYSIPDTGGWIFVGAGAALLLLVIFEWRNQQRKKGRFTKGITMVALPMLVMLNSCTPGPEPLKIGKDNCSFCKMTISDNRYGAELITRKGKVYKFDDSHCLLAFIRSNTVSRNETATVYFTDFTGTHALLRADQALLLQSDFFKGPMNGNLVAFSDGDSLKMFLQQSKGVALKWNQVNP